MTENKPEYVFECRIIDNTTDEVIINAHTLIPNEKRTGDPIVGMEVLREEAAEMEFWSMFRAFRNKFQQKYEDENYKTDITE